MTRNAFILGLVALGVAAVIAEVPPAYDGYAIGCGLWILAAVYGYLTVPRRPL